MCMTFWEKGLWNLEVIRFIKHLFYVQYWRAKRARKNYNNKIKTKFWTPSPTPQTSTQDPTSDKSQGGGGSGPPVPPLWIRACLTRTWFYPPRFTACCRFWDMHALYISDAINIVKIKMFKRWQCITRNVNIGCNILDKEEQSLERYN